MVHNTIRLRTNDSLINIFATEQTGHWILGAQFAGVTQIQIQNFAGTIVVKGLVNHTDSFEDPAHPNKTVIVFDRISYQTHNIIPTVDWPQTAAGIPIMACRIYETLPIFPR